MDLWRGEKNQQLMSAWQYWHYAVFSIISQNESDSNKRKKTKAIMAHLSRAVWYFKQTPCAQTIVQGNCLSGMGIEKKCLGSTEPKWLGSSGCLGPGGVQGQCPAGASRGAKPPPPTPGQKRIWVFGDQFVASQCTEIVKTLLFFSLLPWSIRANISLLSLSHPPIFKTTNI